MNALLVIDKPQGMTSHDVVARVRRICSERSVGHLGTLDPMATGVLPLVLGKMTRLAQFFSDAEKTYEGTLRFGYATNTYDAEGEAVSAPQLLRADLPLLDQLAGPLRGAIQQVPPPYSAKKINGVPAYKLARKEVVVELKPVEVDVQEFSLLALNGNDLSFRATVSAGTYMRSLAHELGQLAGCGAHLASLRRTRAGVFGVEQAVPLQELEARISSGEHVAIHPRNILPEMPSVTADATAMSRLRHGNAVNLPELSRAKFVKVFHGQTELVAIASRIAGTLFQPKIVLC
ncbi:MAG TPA: tRNA pseudouridine(55) synthase TruB [Terriglobales bacterium]|jgi:tRNA pseudouridine55 synthase